MVYNGGRSRSVWFSSDSISLSIPFAPCEVIYSLACFFISSTARPFASLTEFQTSRTQFLISFSLPLAMHFPSSLTIAALYLMGTSAVAGAPLSTRDVDVDYINDGRLAPSLLLLTAD